MHVTAGGKQNVKGVLKERKIKSTLTPSRDAAMCVVLASNVLGHLGWL